MFIYDILQQKSHKLVKKNLSDKNKKRKRKTTITRGETDQTKKKIKRIKRKSKTVKMSIKPFGRNDDDVNELTEYIFCIYIYLFIEYDGQKK